MADVSNPSLTSAFQTNANAFNVDAAPGTSTSTMAMPSLATANNANATGYNASLLPPAYNAGLTNTSSQGYGAANAGSQGYNAAQGTLNSWNVGNNQTVQGQLQASSRPTRR